MINSWIYEIWNIYSDLTIHYLTWNIPYSAAIGDTPAPGRNLNLCFTFGLSERRAKTSFSARSPRTGPSPGNPRSDPQRQDAWPTVVIHPLPLSSAEVRSTVNSPSAVPSTVAWIVHLTKGFTTSSVKMLHATHFRLFNSWSVFRRITGFTTRWYQD